MLFYMTQFSYQPGIWPTLENSLDSIFEGPAKERGIRLHQLHCCEGKGMIIFEAPDETAAMEAISTSSLLASVQVYETTPVSIVGQFANRTNFLSASGT